MIRVAVIGYGYWGPNLIRNFHETEGACMAVCCEVNSQRLEQVQTRYPWVELTTEYNNWHGLLRTPTDWAPIWHSLWVCALYAVPALIAGYLVFLRRDVAGG